MSISQSPPHPLNISVIPQNYFSPDESCQMNVDILDSNPVRGSESESNEGSRFNATGFDGLCVR